MVKITPLGERLLSSFSEEFGITDKGEIARKLGFKSEQAVYKIIGGARGLRIGALIKFRNSTKRSIDWLLTGEGEKYIKLPQQELDQMLPENRRAIASEEFDEREIKRTETQEKEIEEETLVQGTVKLKEVESRVQPEISTENKKSTPL